MQDQDILNYLKGKLTSDEQGVMENWILASEENARRFNRIKAVFVASGFDETAKTVDTEKAYARLASTVQARSKKSVSRSLSYLKYAAGIAAILGSIYFFQKGGFDDPDTGRLVPGAESITLELADGTVKTLSEDGDLRVMDNTGNVIGTQNGARLTYDGGPADKETAYNTLTVPYGKRFELRLSDSTRVHLNAGTFLKYPVRFARNAKREVFLTGEAYFDVAEDASHPFIVNAGALNVAVTGTQFNVAAYPEDATSNVVLVEGSVELFTNLTATEEKHRLILEPGFKGVLDRRNGSISSKKVRTSIHTAWLNGELVFRNIPFDTILLKMERYYNITFINRNKALGRDRFNASFREEPIERILRYFNETHEIQYHIENNQVIID